MLTIQNRIKRTLGIQPGFDKNLQSASDMTYQNLVANWKEAAGILYSGHYIVLADETGGSNTPLQVVSGSEHNPLEFTITNVHVAAALTYSLVFATTFTGLTFDADKFQVAILRKVSNGGAPISKTARVSAVDNTAGGTTVGFTVSLSSSSGSSTIDEDDEFFIEITQI